MTADAAVRSPAARVAVIGADHLHLFMLVDALVQAGADAVAHVTTGELIELYESWQTGSEARSVEAVIEDDDIDLVVLAGVSSERAEIAVAALEAGRSVLSAKPGVTTAAQLDRVRAALVGRPGRPWTVLYSERFTNRAIARAIDMVANGAVGQVVAVNGQGPHAVMADQRPEWFFDPDRSGGILVDLGSHQIDQFLSLVSDPDAVRLSASWVGNVANVERRDMQDIGSMTLVAPGVVGEHRVDYLSPAGLDTWGDVRLSVTGTTGTIEVRANIDVAGEPGSEHLIHVDGDGARRVEVSEDRLTWAEDLLADLADGGERLMTQHHVMRVCALSLEAQQSAQQWGQQWVQQ